jgi:hypothetical protein
MKNLNNLSHAQLKLLRSAHDVGANGIKDKLPVGWIKQITINILKQQKMIEEDWDIRDGEEREKLEYANRESIALAKEYLNDGEDWFAAYKLLERVNTTQNKLNRMAWWLTEEAVTLLESLQKERV